MLVECPRCKTRLRLLNEEKIKTAVCKFKCSKCGAIISIKKTATAPMNEAKDKPAYTSAAQEEGAHKESSLHFSDRQERRKYVRYPFREEIIIDGTKRCTCSDISELGLYISTIQSFEEKGIIEVTIPFHEEFLTVKAQVQYSQPGIGIGVMFIDLTDEQKTIIREIIEAITQ
jgi:predicted Zn finger-like uncharacterized protein